MSLTKVNTDNFGVGQFRQWMPDEWKISLDSPTMEFYVSPGWLNGDEGDKYVFRTDSSDEFAYIYYYYNCFLINCGSVVLLQDRPSSNQRFPRSPASHPHVDVAVAALSSEKTPPQVGPNTVEVLWDYAGALEMLQRNKLALRTYQRLIGRGIDSTALDECGEGIGWARSLIADSHYRAAHCCRKIGRIEVARNHFENHLALGGPGCRSIYNLNKVRSEIAKLA